MSSIIIEPFRWAAGKTGLHHPKSIRILCTILALAGLFMPPFLGGQRTGTLLLDSKSLVEMPTSKPPVVSFSREGMLIADHDRFASIKVHGYAQADGRFFAANLKDQTHQTLLFRRVRPLVEGSLAHRVEFRFMPDFGEGHTVIQEAYAEWALAHYAAFRVGKFKSPIGLEVLRSDRELTFPERSLASDLVPIRDLGMQLGGSLKAGSIEYAAGVFSGTEDGANAEFDWQGENEVAARVFLLPFLSSNTGFKHLGLGIAGSLGNNHAVLPTFKTIGQQTFFKYGSKVATVGAHERFAPQAYYFLGPFGLMSEYVRSDEVAEVSARRREMSNRAWQIAGSYVLTGEKNSYDGVRAARGFDPTHPLRSSGAWEIAVRHSETRMDKAAFPLYADSSKSAQAAFETVAGVNWYVNRYVKLISDFTNTSFHAPPGARPLVSERLAITRLQFAF